MKFYSSSDLDAIGTPSQSCEENGPKNTDGRIPANRHFDGIAVHPGRIAQDWKRSYVLEPDGVPPGAVALLHGLTDSPGGQLWQNVAPTRNHGDHRTPYRRHEEGR